jgi:hypothetical protein
MSTGLKTFSCTPYPSERSTLKNLSVPTKANNYRPPVRSISLRKSKYALMGLSAEQIQEGGLTMQSKLSLHGRTGGKYQLDSDTAIWQPHPGDEKVIDLSFRGKSFEVTREGTGKAIGT